MFCAVSDVDLCLSNVCQVIDSAVSVCVPVKKHVKKFRKIKTKGLLYTATINEKHVKRLRIKTKLWRKYRIIKIKTDCDKYKLASLAWHKVVRNEAIGDEKKILSGNDAGCFYKYVNRKLGCKSGVKPLKRSDGSYEFDNRNLANMLNISFTSSNIIDNGIIPRYMGPTSDGRISNVYFNSFNVKKAMFKQKNKSSSGPDGLPHDSVLKKVRKLSHSY